MFKGFPTPFNSASAGFIGFAVGDIGQGGSDVIRVGGGGEGVSGSVFQDKLGPFANIYDFFWLYF